MVNYYHNYMEVVSMGNFGKRFKDYRLKNGLSLREFCSKNEIDASNLSKMERGVLIPPRETLERYVLALGLSKESDEWYELHDLAATEKGQIPSDIVSDEFINERMPAFFRAARATKGIEDGEELSEKLKEIIRKAWTP